MVESADFHPRQPDGAFAGREEYKPRSMHLPDLHDTRSRSIILITISSCTVREIFYSRKSDNSILGTARFVSKLLRSRFSRNSIILFQMNVIFRYIYIIKI